VDWDSQIRSLTAEGGEILNGLRKWLANRDHNPLVILLPAGLALILIGLGYGASILVEYLHTGIVTRFAGAILSVLFILSGVQIMCFGLLSDIVLTNLQRRKAR
jgi:hypothetical protein